MLGMPEYAQVCLKHTKEVSVEIQTVRLDKETLVALRKIAEKQERTVGWLIRKAVEDFVARDKGGKH